MPLLDNVFEVENLKRACLSVSKALRQAANREDTPRPRKLRIAAALADSAEQISKEIAGEWNSSNPPSFTRKIIAVSKKKRGTAKRPISIFPIYQRVIFRALLNELWPLIEPIVVPSVAYCTFRKNGVHPTRGISLAVTSLRDALANGDKYVFETDISGFFDNINREKLFAIVKRVLPDNSADQLIHAILNSETSIDSKTMRDVEFDPDSGIPQGSALSPLLACAYLSDFDKSIENEGWQMIRYVDDVVVICDSLEQATLAKSKVEKELSKLNLQLKESKTKYIAPGAAIEFLGHCIHGDGRLLPSHKRFNSFSYGIYNRVGRLPRVRDEIVVQDLTSFVLGFYASLRHCDFTESHYRHGARIIRKALISRGLNERRLSRLLPKASKKFPKAFVEEIR